jgi:predicted MFS family arabinose efflux permease
MFFGSRLTKRLGSRSMLIVALSIYSVRMLLYSVIPDASWVLAVQLLHGCSFGLYLIASVTLVHELVGPEFTATAQGLLSSARAFGQMTGALLSGVLLDRIGIVAIYQLSVGIIVLTLTVFVVGWRWYGATEVRALHVVADRPGER